MALKDSHRMLLQAFMSRGILNGAEVKKQFTMAVRRFPGDNIDPKDLAGFVTLIKDHIKPLHLEIKKGECEDSGTHYYGLVSTIESSITRLASDYTVNELEFFKKIIEAMVDSDTGTVSSTVVLNLADTLEKKITKKEAQDLMERMKEAKWLCSNARGEISLSVRSIMELDLYIREQFNAVQCNMCSRLCLKGQLCNSCDVKLHLRCSERLFTDQAEPKCPACLTAWPHEIPTLRTQASQNLPGSPQRRLSSQPSTSTQADHEPAGKRTKRTR